MPPLHKGDAVTPAGAMADSRGPRLFSSAEADDFAISDPDALLALLGVSTTETTNRRRRGRVFEIARREIPPPLPERAEAVAEEAVDDDETELVEVDQEPPVAVRAAPEIAALCRAHLPLADKLVREIHELFGSVAALDSLASAARLGLVQAAQRYDASRGMPFAAWARWRVVGAIRDELRAQRVILIRPRYLMSARLAVVLGGRDRCVSDGAPTGDDAAWLDAWRAVLGVRLVPVGGRAEQSGAVADDEPSPEESLLCAERLRALHAAIAALDPPERRVVERCYFDEVTLEEATELSKSWASRLLGRAIVALKRSMLRSGFRSSFRAGALPALDVSTPKRSRSVPQKIETRPVRVDMRELERALTRSGSGFVSYLNVHTGDVCDFPAHDC